MTEIILPQTENEFDDLIERMVLEFKLPNKEHAAAVVANRIQLMEPDKDKTTLEYLAACVRKNVAYQIARSRSQKIQHKEQIDNLISFIKSNPNDMEARDALQKAISDGSEYAKEQLFKADLEPIDNLVGLIKDTAEETVAAEVPSEPA